MSKDYYKTLGVNKGASKDEIKKAFRTLAHKYHPDKGGDAEKFKEVNEAYGVLSDDKKRAQYEQFGSDAPSGFGGSSSGFGGFDGFDFSGFSQGGNGANMEFDLGDIFGEVFGGGSRRGKSKKGADISIDVELTFKESIFGKKHALHLHKTSVCDLCKGSGAEKGSALDTCSTCKGSGVIRQLKQSVFGQFESKSTCTTCHGKGNIPKTRCSQCKGTGVYKKQTEIMVEIPAGIENGETLRLSGYGEAVEAGISGDLYISIHVKKHPDFIKQGDNLVTSVEVKLSDALLGIKKDLETLEGSITLAIPEGILHGEVLKVKGKGVPRGSSRGDLLVQVRIKMPKLNKDLRKKIEELKKEGL